MAEESKDRLQKARAGAGFPSAADAARRFGWAYSTYAAHENGQNEIRPKNAQIYSRAFKVPASWILTGEGGVGRKTVPLLGYVGAGFAIMPLDDPELEQIEPPIGIREPMSAVRVKGDSMAPAFYDGDTIFYGPGSEIRPAGELVGRECVIRLKDGKMYLKRLLKGSRKGRYLLASYNSDPILDADVDWACPVKFIQRA